MTILSVGEPTPPVREAEVDPQLVEVRIGGLEMVQAGLARSGVRVMEGLVEVEHGVLQTLRGDEALALREAIGSGEQPAQQVKGASQDHHLFGGRSV